MPTWRSSDRKNRGSFAWINLVGKFRFFSSSPEHFPQSTSKWICFKGIKTSHNFLLFKASNYWIWIYTTLLRNFAVVFFQPNAAVPLASDFDPTASMLSFTFLLRPSITHYSKPSSVVASNSSTHPNHSCAHANVTTISTKSTKWGTNNFKFKYLSESFNL